jgi:hypothetical protein
MTKISTVERMVGTKLAVDKHHNLSALETCIPELKDAGKHYQPRGIYLGFTAKNAKEFLTCKIEEKDIQYFDRPKIKILEHWKNRWYGMRLPKYINTPDLDLNPDKYRVESVLGEKLIGKKQLSLF